MFKKLFSKLSGKSNNVIMVPSPAQEAAPTQPKQVPSTPVQPATPAQDEKWRQLSGESLANYLLDECANFARSGNSKPNARLKDIYTLFVGKFPAIARTQKLMGFSEHIESQRGRDVLALVPFVLFDPEPSISSAAAMSLSVLMPLKQNDPMTGVKYTVDLIIHSDMTDSRKGGALRGVVFIGDKRANVFAAKAWDSLSDEGRIALSQGVTQFALAGTIEFWVSCLEKECSDGVFGSVTAALVRLPGGVQVPIVLDAERIFPAYEASMMPFKPLGRYSFGQYADKLRDRLNAIIAKESEPKVVPMIFHYWR